MKPINNKAEFGFSMSGLIISIVVIAMFAGMFGFMIFNTMNNYNVENYTTFDHYKNIIDTNKLAGNLTQNIDSATKLNQNQNAFDVIGSYFTSGFTALQTTLSSIGLFKDLMAQAGNDVPALGQYVLPYFIIIVLIAILVGVLISSMLKNRI